MKFLTADLLMMDVNNVMFFDTKANQKENRASHNKNAR